jgi:hypothetical protein
MIQIVVEYDNMTLMLLLMLACQFHNPSTIGFTKVLMIDDEKSIFGVMTLNDITLQGLLKYECIYFAICM